MPNSKRRSDNRPIVRNFIKMPPEMWINDILSVAQKRHIGAEAIKMFL